ncbi:MAG: hypothetical protein WCK58_14540, partial [Chloroflexota bacterium]
ATSTAFAVTAAAASKLVFTTGPSTVAAGSAISPSVVVKAQDAYGNTVTTYTSNVTISSATTAFTGSTLTVAAVSGAATFSAVKPTTPGGANTLTATSGALTVTSTVFTVNAGAASKLVFTTAPAKATAGSVWLTQPVVAVQDAYGNAITSSTATITLGSSGGTLSGCSATTTGGVATFSGCRIATAGTYTQTAASTGLTSATASLTVTPVLAPGTFSVASGSTSSTLSTSDTMTIVFNAAVDATSLCPSWTSNTSTWTLSDVTVTGVDNTATNDRLTISSTSCSTLGSALGYVDLGSATFLSGALSYTASGVSWNGSTNTMVITIGTGASNSQSPGGVSITYRSTTAMKDLNGVASTGGTATFTVSGGSRAF